MEDRSEVSKSMIGIASVHSYFPLDHKVYNWEKRFKQSMVSSSSIDGLGVIPCSDQGVSFFGKNDLISK